MSFDGRLDWVGPDPEVIKLTDNGVRKVQIRLTCRRRTFDLAANLKDPDAFARALEEARIWVKEG